MVPTYQDDLNSFLLALSAHNAVGVVTFVLQAPKVRGGKPLVCLDVAVKPASGITKDQLAELAIDELRDYLDGSTSVSASTLPGVTS